MGFWGKVEGIITSSNYENDRSELDPLVATTMERALLLLRAGQLTPKKMAKLADWDVDLLTAISRSSVAPGLVKESMALLETARTAAVLAVERSISRSSAREGSGAPSLHGSPAGGSVEQFAEWLASARVEENWRVDLDRDAYIQVGRRPRFVRAEVSGDRSIGGPARLRGSQLRALEAMGWELPRLGKDDFPNYFREFRWGRDEGARVPSGVVWACAQLVGQTLDQVFPE